MRNGGIRRPGRSVLICLAMAVGGALAVLWGATTMNATGEETGWTATAIALGLLIGIFGFIFLFNFLWAMRVVAAIRRGEGVIARWTVTPAEVERFREADRQLRAARDRNDYRLPRRIPAAGLEVLFTQDSVLVGDTYFGLATAGISRFRGVRRLAGDPESLQFDTVLTSVSSISAVHVYHIPGRLRIPIAGDAAVPAARVLEHYQDVVARRTIVKPDFWRRRVRWGLIGATIGALLSATGFALQAAKAELDMIPLGMAVIGAVVVVAGLILALLASALGRFQRRG